MYVITSDSRQISLVCGCFDCFNWLLKKDAGLPVPVEMNFPDHIFVGLGPLVCREGHTLINIVFSIECMFSNLAVNSILCGMFSLWTVVEQTTEPLHTFPWCY